MEIDIEEIEGFIYGDRSVDAEIGVEEIEG